MKKQEFKKRKTYQLRFTKLELLHLRDMMGIMLPPDTTKTVSEALAEVENRTIVEKRLWLKIAEACVEAQVPTGDESPDYIIAPTGTPALGVFEIASEPQDYESDEGEGGSHGFIEEK